MSVPITEDSRARYKRLFSGDPSANFAPTAGGVNSGNPSLTQQSAVGSPSRDYDPNKGVVLGQQEAYSGYKDSLRSRIGAIGQIGISATQIKQQQEQQRQQKLAAQYAQQQQGNYGPVGNYSYNTGSELRDRLLSIVAAQEGTPYSWGGGGPGGASKGIGKGANTVGFDCSGLVQYAYSKIGMKMPRLAEQQATMGRRVPINQLRPGDLVGGPGHIAIYAGNGMMWEAPRTGLNVRLTKVRAGMFGVALGY